MKKFRLEDESTGVTLTMSSPPNGDVSVILQDRTYLMGVVVPAEERDTLLDVLRDE